VIIIKRILAILKLVFILIIAILKGDREEDLFCRLLIKNGDVSKDEASNLYSKIMNDYASSDIKKMMHVVDVYKGTYDELVAESVIDRRLFIKVNDNVYKGHYLLIKEVGYSRSEDNDDSCILKEVYTGRESFFLVTEVVKDFIGNEELQKFASVYYLG